MCPSLYSALVQMATLEKAEGLLEQLRGASYDAAVKDMEELRQFASENVGTLDPLCGSGNCGSTMNHGAGLSPLNLQASWLGLQTSMLPGVLVLGEVAVSSPTVSLADIHAPSAVRCASGAVMPCRTHLADTYPPVWHN